MKTISPNDFGVRISDLPIDWPVCATIQMIATQRITMVIRWSIVVAALIPQWGAAQSPGPPSGTEPPISSQSEPDGGETGSATGTPRFVGSDGNPASSNDLVSGSKEQIQRYLAAGQIVEAAEMARQYDDQIINQPDSDVDLTLPLAQLGRAFQNGGDGAQSLEFFRRANAALDRPASKQVAPATAVLVRLAAASLFVELGKLPLAATTLQKMFASPEQLTDAQQQLAVALCLRLGADSLTKRELGTAEAAYQLAAEHADAMQKPTAMLGAAWAVAMSGSRGAEAADLMIAFVDAFPDHQDAARASQAGIACLKQVGREEEAAAMMNQLFERWPESDAASDVLNQFGAVDIERIPAPLRQMILQRDVDQLTSAMTTIAIRIAAADGDLNHWDRLVVQLGKVDKTGQTTADVLEQWLAPSDAERLATFLLSPPDPALVQAKSRESACRWAGRHERWSMLALASQSTTPATADPTRTVTMERLFAEALMQTGRREEAHAWWVFIVDQRAATDFATLLRCAETEVSTGQIERATQRVDAARNAAGDNRFGRALVAMLSAELGIRRLRFDQARSDLESVVRSSQVDASLRGRAQWMIGETYYLQQKYVEAIEAYRGVAGIDPEGTWVIASLVQAGKSFEQLGRTRDAAVCYSTLVSRHGDSEFAGLASRRLAALSTSDESTSPQSGAPSKTKNPTLKR